MASSRFCFHLVLKATFNVFKASGSHSLYPLACHCDRCVSSVCGRVPFSGGDGYTASSSAGSKCAWSGNSGDEEGAPLCMAPNRSDMRTQKRATAAPETKTSAKVEGAVEDEDGELSALAAALEELFRLALLSLRSSSSSLLMVELVLRLLRFRWRPLRSGEYGEEAGEGNTSAVPLIGGSRSSSPSEISMLLARHRSR